MVSRASDVRNEHLDRQRGKCLQSFRGGLEPNFGVSRTVYALFGSFQAGGRAFRTWVTSCMHSGSWIVDRIYRPMGSVPHATFDQIETPPGKKKIALRAKVPKMVNTSSSGRTDGADTPGIGDESVERYRLRSETPGFGGPGSGVSGHVRGRSERGTAPSETCTETHSV